MKLLEKILLIVFIILLIINIIIFLINRKTAGTIIIDVSNSEKDRVLIVFEDPINNIYYKKKVTLKTKIVTPYEYENIQNNLNEKKS